MATSIIYCGFLNFTVNFNLVKNNNNTNINQTTDDQILIILFKPLDNSPFILKKHKIQDSA